MTAAERSTSSGRLRTLDVRDTIRVLGAVVVPILGQGVIVRRPRSLALAADADADARAAYCCAA